MSVENIFVLLLGFALVVEGVRYTAKIASLLPFTTSLDADDRLGVTTMFGGIQLAFGLYVLAVVLIFDSSSSALLFLAITFGVIGSYRVAGFVLSSVSRKQLWFGIVELILGIISALLLLSSLDVIGLSPG